MRNCFEFISNVLEKRKVEIKADGWEKSLKGKRETGEEQKKRRENTQHSFD